MAFETIAGATVAGTGQYGYEEAASSSPLSSAAYNRSLQDSQQPAAQGLLSGVLVNTGLSVSGLVLTIADLFRYYALTVWQADGAVTVNLTDAATNYVWGCSDGEIRVTTSSSFPTLFDARTACLLCIATTSGGAVTTFNTAAQECARYAAGRIASENAGFVGATPETLPSGSVVCIPSTTKARFYGSLSARGRLIIDGKARIETWDA